MSNIANIQKLHYCDKKSGNLSSCAKVATFCVDMVKKGAEVNKHQIIGHYRCESHKNTATTNLKVYNISKFDQSYTLQMINNFLKSLIGKKISSSFHTARHLEVKFLKDNGGVMCFQPLSKKWKYVYYHQIDYVF